MWERKLLRLVSIFEPVKLQFPWKLYGRISQKWRCQRGGYEIYRCAPPSDGGTSFKEYSIKTTEEK
jgi:hypothetical protein